MSSDGFLMSEEFRCYELPPPPDKAKDAARLAVRENPENALGSSGKLESLNSAASLSLDPTAEYLVVHVMKKWQLGRTLKIKFLSGTPDIHKKVKGYASQWTKHANLKFQWLEKGDKSKAEIRVDFVQGGGSSSYVGVDALTITDQAERTMNLDINLSHSEEYIRRKVLHEFGHVMGCCHEHQSPNASYKWNTEVIYREMAGKPNYWSRKTTDHNILNPLNLRDVSATRFDPDSIMLYEYPAHWFVGGDGRGTRLNTTLSRTDVDWIKATYPHTSNDVGTFSTLQLRDGEVASASPAELDIAFEPSYATPPRLALGLSWLHVSHEHDVDVRARADGVNEDYFTCVIEPGPQTGLFQAACSFLQISASDPDVQTGVWELPTEGVTWTAAADADPTRPSNKNKNMRRTTATTVRFPTSFDAGAAPVVVAFFSGLRLGAGAPWRVRTYAADPSPFKTKLLLEAGADTDLRGAAVTWIAFPADKSGIVAGTFATADTPGPDNAGTVTFAESAGFRARPDVMMAISGLDFENGRDLHLRLSNSGLSATGMAWHLDGGADSAMNTATGAYVAIGKPVPADEFE